MSFKEFASSIAYQEDEPYNIDGGCMIQEDGRSALHIAVLKNDQAMVTNLLMEGADPNIKDACGMNALSLAFNQNHMSISKIIMKTTKKIDFTSQENSGFLLHAIEKLDVEMTKTLLFLGCNPNLAKDTKTGEYCLH